MSQLDNPNDFQSGSDRRSLPLTVIATIAVVLGVAVLLSVLSILGVIGGEAGQPESTTPFVQILQPASGAELPISEVLTISGTASGLYEGSLIVQVLDAQNKVLVETPANIKIEAGGDVVAGTWSVQVIVMTDPGTQGVVRAYAPSLTADRIAAEESIPVSFTSQAVETYIDILEPVEGTVLDLSTLVVVSGMAGNLFEGSLVVEALDESGNSLAFQPTIIDSPNAGVGGEGPWRVELPIKAFPGTKGYLRAYSDSPKDGSIVAEDSVQVIYGDESLVTTPYIEIQAPQDGAVLDISAPVAISGIGGGLFEGNVVVEAVDQGGNVLAQQTTVLQSAEAGMGGEGPWSVSLVIESALGIPGIVRAVSDSPMDGSIVAMDSINVTFGEDQPAIGVLPLESTAWQLISISGEPVLEGSLVWVLFREGTLNGSAGCNSYFASYLADEGSLSIAPVATTKMLCAEPVGVMEQENAYTSLLESTVTYAIEGSQLYLADNTGEITLVYAATVIGSVNAVEDTQIPQGAKVSISLEDISRADAPAEIVSELQLSDVKGFPFSFVLPYDLELIDSQMSYAIRVRITGADDELLYTNTRAYPVLTGGNPKVVDVVVDATQ